MTDIRVITNQPEGVYKQSDDSNSVTVTSPAWYNTLSIPHTFGKIPNCEGEFSEDGITWYPLGTITIGTVGVDATDIRAKISADIDNIYLITDRTTTTDTLYIKYNAYVIHGGTE